MKPLCIAFLALAIPASAQNISGSWQGKLSVGPQMSLKLVLNFSEPDEPQTVTLDSPDQGAFGIQGNVNYCSADSVNVSFPLLRASYAGKLTSGKLEGMFTQSGAQLPLSFSPGKDEVKRPQTPKPPFPYTQKEVTFNNPAEAGVSLAGTLTLPENYSSDTPVVAMVSGSGLQNRDEELFGHKPFAVIADYLARNGVASLRYDDRSVGGSTGDAVNADTRNFASDAKAAIDYLRDKERFKKVGILGHSEGGMIAFMLGAKKIPDFIIGIGAPSVSGDSILLFQSGSEMRRAGIPEQVVDEFTGALRKLYPIISNKGKANAVAAIDGLCADWTPSMLNDAMKQNLKAVAENATPWQTFFVTYSPQTDISSTNCPTMVIYGEKDMQVPPSLNLEPMQKAAPRATVKVYPCLNHLMQHASTGAISEYSSIEETISPEVLADITSFILSL